MKKYIRTKDGRILEFDKLNEISKLSIDMAEENIIEADTLEELCDEFIEELPIFKGNEIIGKDHQYWKYNKKDNRFYNDLGECLKHNDFIDDRFYFYGAIYTVIGLIYVIKLNDKGAFEKYENNNTSACFI